MAFTIEGQTKAAVALKGKFGVYGLILLKLCMQVAYFSPRKTCSMAFTIKGQTKAALTAYAYSLRYHAYCSPGMTCYMAFTIKCQTKASASFVGNFGIFGPIFFQVLHAGYFPQVMFGYATGPLLSKAIVHLVPG